MTQVLFQGGTSHYQGVAILFYDLTQSSERYQDLEMSQPIQVTLPNRSNLRRPSILMPQQYPSLRIAKRFKLLTEISEQ